MVITWKKGEDPINTTKAYGFRVVHESQIRVMWIPISQVEYFNKEERVAEIPDWLYDKRIDQLFFGAKEDF